ncbi:MAG: hypothetical protein MUP76_04560 [Acidimicrobiia bacterium]|nr:hypothetical protein [Acidimicrobiia bacterium]
MTVQELIRRLAHFPTDTVVWADGGGDPYVACEITEVYAQTFPETGSMMGHEHEQLNGRTVVMLG